MDMAEQGTAGRIIGVDTGGTFTDLIYQERGPRGETWRVHKLLSTPANPAEAVLGGLAAVSGETREPRRIVHGSTVATNAILERKGVRTGLIANHGFTDVIEIGRQNRTRLYDLAYVREPHIVPPELRFGVPGRMLSTGEVLEEFDEAAAREVAQRLAAAGVESVAVCFLFAFANPEHERRMGAILAEHGLPVSLSHEILSEFREFERTSTTLINAYVSPKMRRYIAFLLERLREGDALRIMQSNGGSISAETAMHESVRTILSGPAGGVVGALEIGRAAGFDRLITFDMGGTSTDVSLLDGELSLTLESAISSYPVKTPMLDIHTVGAGGGSIAGVDAGGSLRVGPESAGADPGPICYGKGGHITVTDANLYLGRLIPEHFLGGTMRLDTERLETAFAELAGELGLEPTEVAEGVLAVANANMERAIRVITVERGFDPREFTLFSFGGAGGMHACHLARLLHVPRVLIPRNPGILSAIGMLMADVIKDYSQTVMRMASGTSPAELAAGFARLAERGREELAEEGMDEARIVIEEFLDMRYEGQAYEIIVPHAPDADFVEAFHAAHERLYGYRNQDKPVQIVNLRVRSRGVPHKPELERIGQGGDSPEPAAMLGSRSVVFEGERLETTVIDRDRLLAGNRFAGPAVVVEYSSTLLIPPFASVSVDAFGNLVIDIDTGERS
jgi:N-methylhydantoinase A